jgi:SAM-dependent methyltransferase
MSLAYRVLYAIGFTPWEQMARSPFIGRQIGELFDREEEVRDAPFGAVLDLGCGSGIWDVELARRGWEVTGVDAVPKALRRARERASEAAGVHPRFVQADVTELPDAEVGSGFRLFLDFGCFHDELTDDQRRAESGEATRLAEPGASLLMMAWAPGRRGRFRAAPAARTSWPRSRHGRSMTRCPWTRPEPRGTSAVRIQGSIACAWAEAAATLR